MSSQRIKMMKKSLEALNPKKIEIEDEGHLHVGHAGAKSGGHFKLVIISNEFKDKTIIDRHKLIYKTLEFLMKTEIHALSIKALTEDEAR